MVYLVIVLWLILGLAVFFVAMRRGPGRAAEDGSRPESKAGRRLTILGVVVLIAFGLVVPTLVLAHNGNHKASEAPHGVQLTAAQTKGRELFAHSCVYLDGRRSPGAGSERDPRRPGPRQRPDAGPALPGQGSRRRGRLRGRRRRPLTPAGRSGLATRR